MIEFLLKMLVPVAVIVVLVVVPFLRKRWAVHFQRQMSNVKHPWQPQHLPPSPHATHTHISLPGPLAHYTLAEDGSLLQHAQRYWDDDQFGSGWGNSGLGYEQPDIDLDQPSDRMKAWGPILERMAEQGWTDLGSDGRYTYLQPPGVDPPAHYEIHAGRQGGKATLRRAAQVHQLPRFHDPIGPIKWNPKFRTWNYVMRSYVDGVFALETVHKGDASLLMEVDAVQRSGSEADIWRISSRDGSLYPLSSIRRP